MSKNRRGTGKIVFKTALQKVYKKQKIKKIADDKIDYIRLKKMKQNSFSEYQKIAVVVKKTVEIAKNIKSRWTKVSILRWKF